MQAIYNKQGHTVAWLSYRDLYDTSGGYIGFIKGYGVFNLKSKYCGSLKQSVFRDTSGLVVAIMKGAKKVSSLPALKTKPHKPTKKTKPVLKPIGSSPSLGSFKAQWSRLNWSQFIA